MDLLHSQLAVLQARLAWVSTEPINWKFYVQAFSWGVCLFESYLLYDFPVLLVDYVLTRVSSLRQYPLYSKTEPPAALAHHLTKDTFQKSQTYGKDKAKFSFLSGIYRQVLDSVMIQYGMYAYAWRLAGKVIAHFGYGPQYEVSANGPTCGLCSSMFLRSSNRMFSEESYLLYQRSR